MLFYELFAEIWENEIDKAKNDVGHTTYVKASLITTFRLLNKFHCQQNGMSFSKSHIY